MKERGRERESNRKKALKTARRRSDAADDLQPSALGAYLDVT